MKILTYVSLASFLSFLGFFTAALFQGNPINILYSLLGALGSCWAALTAAERYDRDNP